MVVEITLRTRSQGPFDRVDEISICIDSLTQGSTVCEDVPNVDFALCASDFDMAVAFDDFDDGTFEEEEAAEAEHEDDDISLGSEDNDYDSSDDKDDDEETGEEELQGNVVGAQVEQENNDGAGDEATNEEEHGDGECRDGSMGRAGNKDDARFCYTAKELRMLKLAHVEVLEVLKEKDLSKIHRAICDSNIFECECVIDSDSLEIHNGMKFNSLQELQFFWQIMQCVTISHLMWFIRTREYATTCYASRVVSGVFGLKLLGAWVSGGSPM